LGQEQKNRLAQNLVQIPADGRDGSSGFTDEEKLEASSPADRLPAATEERLKAERGRVREGG
jgi:hypothetical protein